MRSSKKAKQKQAPSESRAALALRLWVRMTELACDVSHHTQPDSKLADAAGATVVRRVLGSRDDLRALAARAAERDEFKAAAGATLLRELTMRDNGRVLLDDLRALAAMRDAFDGALKVGKTVVRVGPMVGPSWHGIVARWAAQVVDGTEKARALRAEAAKARKEGKPHTGPGRVVKLLGRALAGVADAFADVRGGMAEERREHGDELAPLQVHDDDLRDEFDKLRGEVEARDAARDAKREHAMSKMVASPKTKGRARAVLLRFGPASHAPHELSAFHDLLPWKWRVDAERKPAGVEDRKRAEQCNRFIREMVAVGLLVPCGPTRNEAKHGQGRGQWQLSDDGRRIAAELAAETAAKPAAARPARP